MSAQILQDYRDKKRDPVLGPMTYEECARLLKRKDTYKRLYRMYADVHDQLVAENARLLEALDKSTRALIEATGETA